MQAAIAETPNLTVHAAAVDDLDIADGRISAVVTADGARFAAGAVVLTTGTFLDGIIHIGTERIPAGRHGENRRKLCRGGFMRWPRGGLIFAWGV